MSALELVFRIAGCSELLLLVLLSFYQTYYKADVKVGVKSNGKFNYSVYMVLFFLGICSYLLAPLVVYVWEWGFWAYPIILFAILVPAFFGLLMVDVFLEDKPSRLWSWPLIVLTALVGLVSFGSEFDHFELGRLGDHSEWVAQLFKLAWVVVGLMLAIKDWNSDLVEPRRRLRLLILAGAGCYMLAVLVVELFLDHRALGWVELVNVTLILCLSTLFCLHFLSINTGNIFSAIEKNLTVKEDLHSALAQQIILTMQNDRFYAQENVTIKRLASALESQEYQIRRVINGELGYRNFNEFINLYRVKEVANCLQLPEYDSSPLLTLALESGFRSLAPFNRAFKSCYSVTPSEYRLQQKSK